MMLQGAATDERALQAQEGLMQLEPARIVNPQAFEPVQPGERAFDGPAIDAQATPMGRVALGQHRLDPQAAPYP
jgi:hypothetical protein